ncbi:hypothetical protein [Pontibacter sp. HSC-36F09]|uniref:hypothetical protein n=1 Tax=Pontibacter sp. HSC-36F09 TaxID=2910966 RepID=UPI0020A05EC6|nr:hypothetical protein [Pontibacter sp. HSC-36F09]MCP2043778.1 hypothetical protein [Pontibacter sp. HSC-36F09]
MKSAIAVFFASLISGALSFADFRPAVSDLVQILTGVQLCQENTLEPQQQKDCNTDEKPGEQRLYLISDMNSTQNLRCDEAA